MRLSRPKTRRTIVLGQQRSSGVPKTCTPPIRHGDEIIRVARCQIQVVQDHDDRRAPCPVQVGQEIEHLDLVVDIQEGRRLVEQQDIGLLGKCHGDPDALTLATREFIDRPLGKIKRFRCGKRAVDGLVVLPRPSGKRR